MSTATSRPIGDNEFPVLLRLPDLNAPNWPPAAPVAVTTPANVSKPVAPAEPMAAPSAKSIISSAVSAATAVLSTVAPTTEISKAETKTETKQQREPATAPSTMVAPRLERAARPQPSTAQWTLIRQLATGGVLVGGLALTYFMIMGGKGDTKAPTTADGPLMPTVAETPSPLVVHADNHGGDIPDVPAPPAFGEFKPPVAPPTHIEVAERIDTKPELPPSPPPMSNPLGDVRAESGRDPRGDGFVPHGRIGPANSAVASPYPATDPRRYPPIADEPAIRSATRPMYPTYNAPSSLR